MQEIVKTTRYWLFKPSGDAGEYHFTRIKTDGIKNVMWSLGYKNHNGFVSLIGGENIYLPKSVYIKYLNQLLNKNIDDENYEECSKIRDLIKIHSS
jgi:protein-arginine kinase activator protein McsA